MGIDLIRIKLLFQPIDDCLHLVAAITIIDPPQIDLGINMPPVLLFRASMILVVPPIDSTSADMSMAKSSQSPPPTQFALSPFLRVWLAGCKSVYAPGIGYVYTLFRFIAILQVVIDGDYLIDGLLAGILERG